MKMESISAQHVSASDASYDIRRETGRSGSKWDVVGNEHVADRQLLCHHLLKPVGHAHPFCSGTQFSRLTETFRNWQSADAAFSKKMSMEAAAKRKCGYEKKIILHIGDPCNISLPPGKPSIMSILGRKNCFSGGSVSTKITFCGQWSTTHRRLTSLGIRKPRNIVSGTLWISSETFADVDEPPKNSGRRSMNRLEQKPATVLQTIFKKLTRRDAMALDTCVVTEATAKAFLIGGQHC